MDAQPPSQPNESAPMPTTVQPTDPIAADLFAYIAESPTPFHAAAASMQRLAAAGYEELDELDDWSDVTGRRMVRRGGALIAWHFADTAV